MRQDAAPLRFAARLSKNWWTIALRGAISILFGIAALVFPGVTLVAFVYLFAAFALGSGILLIVAALRDRLHDINGWLLLLEGILGIIVGIGAFIYPGLTALALVYFISAWAIVTGIIEIIAAVQLRKEIANEWMLAIAGIASVIFGVLLALNPGSGALALIWIIAAYAIFFGIVLLILGFRLRNWRGADHRV
jgi:uncharacterized membrane protein HdeD (DUF308 family)